MSVSTKIITLLPHCNQSIVTILSDEMKSSNRWFFVRLTTKNKNFTGVHELGWTPVSREPSTCSSEDLPILNWSDRRPGYQSKPSQRLNRRIVVVPHHLTWSLYRTRSELCEQDKVRNDAQYSKTTMQAEGTNRPLNKKSMTLRLRYSTCVGHIVRVWARSTCEVDCLWLERALEEGIECVRRGGSLECGNTWKGTFILYYISAD